MTNDQCPMTNINTPGVPSVSGPPGSVGFGHSARAQSPAVLNLRVFADDVCIAAEVGRAHD